MNKGQKAKANEFVKQKEKRLQEEVLQQKLQYDLKKVNVTVFIITSGCISYVQVLDVTVNKIMKQYIKDFEDQLVDKHFDKWKASKFNIEERRVLLTEQVGKAQVKLYKYYQDAIIKTFQNVGLFLLPNSLKDNLLKI